MSIFYYFLAFHLYIFVLTNVHSQKVNKDIKQEIIT